MLDVDRFLADKPLAITISGLEELRAHILARIAMFDREPTAFIENALRALQEDRAQPMRGRPRVGAASSTGVIPVQGTISQHAQGDLSSFLMGGATTEGIASELDAMMADETISKIVLNIDSPGGSVYGVTELANKIMSLRGGSKPIIAVANSVAASAAYWIGSAADQFYVTPGGLVGSIGVYGLHQDMSAAMEREGVKTTLISAGKFKTEGNPFEPLSDEARTHAQARIDDAYGMFLADVAKGRGVPVATVRAGYGEGDVVTAKQARSQGMVDGIATLDQVISKSFAPAPAPAPSAQASVTVQADPKPEAPARPRPRSEPEPDEEDEPDEEPDEADEEGEEDEAAERLGRFRNLQFKAAAAGAVG